MRIEVTDPRLIPSLLGFLRGHVHLTVEQVGPTELEVSQLGSMNVESRRQELDLMLSVWRRSHGQVPAAIVGS